MTHPVLQRAAEIEAALKDLADLELSFMVLSDKREALTTLSRLDSELTSLRLRLTAASADVADDAAARDVASWLAHHTRSDRSETSRHERLARILETWTALGRAIGEGAVNPAQAEVIALALNNLPTAVGDDIRHRAESHLVEEAARFGPRELRILGRRVLDVVAPEVGEDHERRQLEHEQSEARKTTRLSTRRNGDGTTNVFARVPDAVADRLTTYLEAYTSPRRDDGTPVASAVRPADGERTPYDVRLGHAFCAFLEHADPARLPVHGGDATNVTVTIDLESLRDMAGSATTDGGDALSAAECRRLACTAGIIPAVLGTDGEVLDLGRSSRLFTRPQRRAMRLRDQECRTLGCRIPAAWCEAHHAGDPWCQGGKTDLADGALLCSFHHHRAHDPGYLHSRLPNGDFRFHRRR